MTLIKLLVCLTLIGNGICQTICSNSNSRALILSGGGAKGAFEAGASYHFIVHRGCDFQDLAGVSVGALNTAYLAQAERDKDPVKSLTNLQNYAEGLVNVWKGIQKPSDILKPRFLAELRWAVFGLESMNDFSPLRKLIAEKINPELIRKGREVRVGTVGVFDGGYVEVLASDLLAHDKGQNLLDFVYASSAIPVYSEMPRISMGSESDPKKFQQYADGGVRQVIPIPSYFRLCHAVTLQFQMLHARTGTQSSCVQNSSVPPHVFPIQELFVVVASPFHADDDHDWMSEDDPELERGTHQITNGKNILNRTMGLLIIGGTLIS